MQVLKIGGHDIADDTFLCRLTQAVGQASEPVIIVHGGGKEISELQSKLDIKPRYIDGVRITDAEALPIVEMILCGIVNKRLVRYFISAEVDAMGLSGVDRGLVRATKMTHSKIENMGYTGVVSHVRGDVVLDLVKQGITPIIAPICLGEDSNYNVNADHVASAIAVATDATQLVFLTNIAGVMQHGEIHPVLTPTEIETLINQQIITDGMIPKVRMATHALEQGVYAVKITNLAGFISNTGTLIQKG